MAKSLIHAVARTASKRHKILQASTTSKFKSNQHHVLFCSLCDSHFGCDPPLVAVGSRFFSAGVVRASPLASKLTPAEVTSRLRGNEFTTGEEEHIFRAGPVKSVDFNKLKSNNPIEDAHAEGVADLGDRKALLFAIIDGHGGASCSQVLSRRLLDYVSACLLSASQLDRHIAAVTQLQQTYDGQTDRNAPSTHSLVTYIKHPIKFVHRLEKLYLDSYLAHLLSLKARFDAPGFDAETPIPERLSYAFSALDADLSREAVETVDDADPDFTRMTASVAASGAVAAVAVIDGADLYVASAGDCTVVLGSVSENDTWIAKRLTVAHSSDNQSELKRIQAEHPKEKIREIIRGERLLGILAPLRAFGDFKLKWPAETIERVLGRTLGAHAVPAGYHSPPYLTVEPEVMHHRLTTRDKFMVIGTDGLWDMMTPMQVIRLVGEHMSGKITLTPLVLGQQERNVSLGEINKVLRQRQAAMKLKPADANSATHLLRSALGGTAYGVDHARLSQMLSLPQDMVRMFRDDITLLVPFFDSEFLGHH